MFMQTQILCSAFSEVAYNATLYISLMLVFPNIDDTFVCSKMWKIYDTQRYLTIFY